MTKVILKKIGWAANIELKGLEKEIVKFEIRRQ